MGDLPPNIQMLDPLPEPKLEQPYRQLEYVVNRKKVGYAYNTQLKFVTVMRLYIEFWENKCKTDPDMGGDRRFYIREHWTPVALQEFKLWLDSENNKCKKTTGAARWVASTLASHVSKIKAVIDYAIDHKWVSEVISVSMAHGVRETDRRSAYTDAQLAALLDKNRAWVVRAMRLVDIDLDPETEAQTEAASWLSRLVGYQKTGKGTDPRIGTDHKRTPDDAWHDISNLQWYFENVLHCKPFPLDAKSRSKKHVIFKMAARNWFGGDAIYALWGPTLVEYEQMSAKEKHAAYPKTGKGSDPRFGWLNQDNMLWYFENVMDGIPLRETNENREGPHRRFLETALRYHGGVDTLYRKWNVTSMIGSDLIIPLALKLCYETGLNVESLLDLKRGCYKIDELTGLPYLEYYKRRSGGEKIMPVSLFDQHGADTPVGTEDDIETEGPEQIPIFPKQAELIRKTISAIEALTDSLLDQAKDEDKECLFLYQSQSSQAFAEVARIEAHTVIGWLGGIFNQTDYCLIDVESRKMREYSSYCDIETRRVLTVKKPRRELALNLSRLRPTRITNLIRQGYDILAVSHIMGHKSILQTIEYLSLHNIRKPFYREIERALTNIKNNAGNYKRKVIPIAKTAEIKPGEFIYTTRLCHCKNPISPDTHIQEKTGWQPGSVCRYYNMCLTCDKILITEHSLPKLFAYRRLIEMELARGESNVPDRGGVLLRDASILDQILIPGGDNPFTKAELDMAKKISAVNDFPELDAYLLRGVMA